MGTPFLGEVKIISWNFSPKGWAFCNGQLLPINQNQALFSLFGTTYGGDGRVNFALPDLRGRCATHVGSGHTQGERAGEVAHTLNVSELPAHLHAAFASPLNADVPVVEQVAPAGPSMLAAVNNAYRAPSALTTLHPAVVANTGGNQPHENMSPFLVLNFITALQGVFPSQN